MVSPGAKTGDRTIFAAYEEDLAYIHDVGFGDFARKSAPGLLAILRQRGIENGRVIDLGCGSGIWARALVDAGYQVTGVDLSAAMIGIARKRVPEAEFQIESFLSVSLPRCGCVTARGEVLNYLSDRKNNRAALRRLFRRVFTALRPDGLFICDLAGQRRHRGSRQRFFDGDGWTTLIEFQHDSQRNRLMRRIITFRKVGKSYRCREETHVLQLYPARDIAVMLRQAGFRVRIVRGYGDFPLFPDTAGFVARKP